MARCERLVSSFGKLPENWLKEKSTTSRMVNLAISGGIGPVRLLCDKSLHNQKCRTNESHRHNKCKYYDAHNCNLNKDNMIEKLHTKVFNTLNKMRWKRQETYNELKEEQFAISAGIVPLK